MKEIRVTVAVVGGGPAGLSAAISAKKHHAESVLIIERDKRLGGILQQCIHPGFGLNYFHEELTGPEYAARFIEEAKEVGVESMLDIMVIGVDPDHESTCEEYCTRHGLSGADAGEH